MTQRDASREDRAVLDPLDPDADAGAGPRFVAQVMHRVALRHQHPMAPDPLIGVSTLAWPIGLAASLAIVGALAFAPAVAPTEARAPRTIAEALSVPREFLSGDAPPEPVR